MSSLIRRIEKRIIKKMGVSRSNDGYIKDSNNRIVGSGDGTKWPKFSDIVGKIETVGNDQHEHQ